MNRTRQVIDNEYKHNLLKIEKSLEHEDETLCCYVFGLGKQTRSAYSKLQDEIPGAQVEFYSSILSGILKPLSFMIASYFGIVKIKDKKSLSKVFMRLVNMSMCNVYVFDASLEKQFIELVKSCGYKDQPVDAFISKCNKYLIYKVDTDNVESKTGCYEIVNCSEQFNHYIN
jgi:hypothetical protein